MGWCFCFPINSGRDWRVYGAEPLVGLQGRCVVGGGGPLPVGLPDQMLGFGAKFSALTGQVL